MKPRWLLVLAVFVLMVVPAAAQQGTNSTGAGESSKSLASPQEVDALFPTARGQHEKMSAWERAALTSRGATPSHSSAAALASTSPDQSPMAVNDDKWEIIFAPYLYLPGIDGNMGVGRASSVPLDISAGSILENFQFGFMGRFEVRKRRWGGIFEASYVKLGASVPMTGAVIGTERVTDAEFEMTMLEGFLSYRPYQSDKTSVDLFGGARYWDMDIDLDITGPLLSESLTRGERWADPVFGVRVVHFVSNRWFIPVRGDLGGFGGVGKTSDFTWNIQGGIGFQANKHFSLVMQYKAIGVDFDNDKQGTPDFFAFDAIQHGPLFGFVFKF